MPSKSLDSRRLADAATYPRLRTPVLKGIKMLSKPSKSHQTNVLSTLMFFPQISGLRKAEKSKAIKMLNVLEVGAHTMQRVVADHAS